MLIFVPEIENMGNRQIKVVMMDEALAFFRLLPQKVQEKISYNFLKIEQGVIDKELFKKLVVPIFGSFVLCSMATVIGCSPFGIRNSKRWSSPRMVS